MRQRTTYLLGALGAALVLYVLSRTKAGAGVAVDAVGFVTVTAQRIFSWAPPGAAKPYLPAIDAAERAQGLPRNLLARMAYQESRFRPDIISGQTKSSAGAIGILQIIPKWHPGVDPYDALDSIDYAARFVRRLFNRFGDWKLALAAYNWGEGNVSKFAADRWPAETVKYVREITRDVGIA